MQRGKILLAAARDAVEPFGLSVVRLEVRIGNRPIPDRARNALAVVFPRLKILLTRPDQGPAVKTRAAAENAAHIKALGLAVDVDLAVVIRPLIDEHRLFVVSWAGR